MKKANMALEIVVKIALAVIVVVIILYLVADKAGITGKNLNSCETKGGTCIKEISKCETGYIAYECPKDTYCCIS